MFYFFKFRYLLVLHLPTHYGCHGELNALEPIIHLYAAKLNMVQVQYQCIHIL